MLNINSFLKKSVKCMETDNKTLFWVIKVISEIFSYLLWTKTSIKYLKGTAPQPPPVLVDCIGSVM